MKVALVHMRHALSGGTEAYLNHVARHLAERGDDVTIVCRSRAEAPHPAVRFEVLRPLAIGGAWRLSSFARAVERHVAARSYDVVYGLGKTWTHDVLRLGGGCQATYLEHAHEATLSGFERVLATGGLKHRAALAIERRALAPGAYRLVVVNSDMVGRDVVRRHGVDPARLRRIYNGVDLERFHPQRREREGAALRRELGFAEGDLVVLFLGTGYGRKGLDRLLAALPVLFERDRRARLLVVGRDSQQGDYVRRAKALGTERVRFLGGRRDVEACFAAGDVYALPTRYDPFANTTLEALASGLPTITTPTNGASELIRPGVDGALVDGDDAAQFADALLAWTDAEHRRAGARAARETAEQHSLESKMAQSAAVLDEARTLAPAGLSR